MPLGGNVGTTNAVMFGVVLMGYRDAELNVFADRLPPPLTNHDMDAPPWWHYQRKSHIYIDGFAERGHRALMQFMLVKQNGPERFREWEEDFRDVEAYLKWLPPPKYPFPIDRPLAERGQVVFRESCAKCHGTYGDGSKYPEKIVPIAEIGTDRVRFDALTAKHRANYGASWFANLGRDKTRAEPAGDVAPPLDGVWASGPYFHNGAVPTLWHVLHPAARPKVWRRTSPDGYDAERGGLVMETADARPEIRTAAERRTWFNTRGFGKSAAGHDYPDELNEEEKRAVLEYLKTL
jgi:mono/diheme cytochrome c family protein